MRARRAKAIVGIEAAIVLIAFVIVAASLAFVALNMGMFTTQKSKEVIQRGLGESSSALEVDGTVMARADSSGKVNLTAIPLKVAPGRGAVDLAREKSVIKLTLTIGSMGKYFEDIHKGVYYYNGTHLVNAEDASDARALSSLDIDDIGNALWASAPASPEAYVVFVRTSRADTVMEYGEKALVVIALDGSNQLSAYDGFMVEVRPPEGAPLTVERTIPATLPSGGGAVSLG